MSHLFIDFVLYLFYGIQLFPSSHLHIYTLTFVRVIFVECGQTLDPLRKWLQIGNCIPIQHFLVAVFFLFNVMYQGGSMSHKIQNVLFSL